MNETSEERRHGAAGAAGGGTSIVGLLGLVFITLKLTGVIDWSWLWVLAPFWMPVAVFVGILLIILAVWLLIDAASWRKKRRMGRWFMRDGQWRRGSGSSGGE